MYTHGRRHRVVAALRRRLRGATLARGSALPRLEICSSSGERSPRLRTLSRRTSDSSCQQQAMALRLLCLLAACLACASGFAAPLSRAAVQPRSSEVYCVTYGVQES